MNKALTGTLIAALLAAGLVWAQESAPDPDTAGETAPAEAASMIDPMVLVDDPEPGEPEVFAAEGDVEAEIITEAEMVSEADAAAALDGEMVGDMAAMPEEAERPDW